MEPQSNSSLKDDSAGAMGQYLSHNLSLYPEHMNEIISKCEVIREGRLPKINLVI